MTAVNPEWKALYPDWEEGDDCPTFGNSWECICKK
jgi:hypothetical protein